NGENSIAETINSVLSQTMRDFELIICDDGSTDNTAAVINAINDDRIRFYPAEKRGGPVANCNRALSLAKGKYFKVLMQDDLLAPEHLEYAVKLFESDPDIVMTTCSTNIIDGSGKVTMVRRHCGKDAVFDGIAYAKRSLHGRNIFGEPSITCYRREVYDSGIRYRDKYKFNFDWDFSIRAVMGKKLAYILKPLAAFRISDTSISGNYYKKNKRLIYNENMELFNDHKQTLGLTGTDLFIFKTATVFLLAAKMVYTVISQTLARHR
ncbi:MAG: glycosyltransferase, partial [Firmicutes bacterium]|nr:glycosyltransferase [Bacillota bacterium]